MNKGNNSNKDSGNSSGNSPAPATQAGWAYPWGYHLPCYTTADSNTSHACDKTKRYGNFIVNEDASHFEN